MKILLLNANRVGIGTYHRALNFGRELARRGADVTMMTVSDAERFRAVERRETDRMRIIECPNFLDGMLPWRASGIFDIALRVREIWTGNYDLVYAFEYQPNISVPVFLAKPFRSFTLVSDWCDWHAGASYHFGGHRWAHAIDRVFEEFIRHRADFVTTINKTLLDRARSIGIDERRLAIVQEGVDPSYISPLDRDRAREALGISPVPIVATIRDSFDSAQLLCEAVARSTVANLHLLYIGTTPDALCVCAQQLGIAKRLITPGRVSDADLPRYLACADVMGLPLKDDLINRGRWPHKLGDMLAAQRPVIVSRGGEFPELLEHRQCAVVVDHEPDAFARSIDDVITDPERFVPMARRGRALIETELNWTVIGDQLQDVVRRATT